MLNFLLGLGISLMMIHVKVFSLIIFSLSRDRKENLLKQSNSLFSLTMSFLERISLKIVIFWSLRIF